MAFAEVYRRQVALLIRVIPFVAAEKAFALKGGTAINLFIRNMPRLSVDIDLTYLSVDSRENSLPAIDAAMKRIADRVRAGIPGVRITEGTAEGAVTKLFVRAENAQIKIEVTPVLRGTAYEPAVRQVSPAVEDAFGFAEMNVVSFADLYGGKIVAALDRQHPRDLFDIRDLLAEDGIDESLRRAFIVYLLSHGRPMSEVLGAKPKDLSVEFARGFEGGSSGNSTMTRPIPAVIMLPIIRSVTVSSRNRRFNMRPRSRKPSTKSGNWCAKLHNICAHSAAADRGNNSRRCLMPPMIESTSVSGNVFGS